MYLSGGWGRVRGVVGMGTVRDMGVDREKVAGEVNALTLRVPVLPDDLPVSDAELSYVVARVRELIGIWRTAGIEPVRVSISAERDLLLRLRVPAAEIVTGAYPYEDPGFVLPDVDGVPVSAYSNPALYAGSLGSDSFVVEIDASSPVAVWLRPALGLAFPGRVDPGMFATRWVLQEVDGMDPGDAQPTAELL